MKEDLVKGVAGFILQLANIPIAFWVSFQVYGYFYLHTGFNLPRLTFINIACLIMLRSALFANYRQTLDLTDIKHKVLKKTDKKLLIYSVRNTSLILSFWLASYIISLIVL